MIYEHDDEARPEPERDTLIWKFTQIEEGSRAALANAQSDMEKLQLKIHALEWKTAALAEALAAALTMLAETNKYLDAVIEANDERQA